MKKLILLSLITLFACKKEAKEQVITNHTLQVTGYGMYATIDINGSVYYPPLITFTVKTNDVVKFKDNPTGSNNYRNIVLSIDNNTKYAYSGYGVAETTLTIK